MASDRLGPWGFTRSLTWSRIGLVSCGFFTLVGLLLLVLDLTGKASGTQVFVHAVLFFLSAVFTFRFTLNLLWVRREIAQGYIAADTTDVRSLGHYVGNEPTGEVML